MRQRLPPALRIRDFALLWAAILALRFAENMVAVAIGWQVFAIHRDPLDLGLIGLMEFIPLPLLALPMGQLTDRLPRRFMFAAGLAVALTVSALLLVVTLHGATQLWPFLSLAALTGVANSVAWPAYGALTPELVPTELVPGAMALRSIASQISVVVGPAIGGVLFAVRPMLVYAVAVGLFAVAIAGVLSLRPPALVRERSAPSVADLVAGVRFVLRTRILLGAISLDLFAVLFGGAVALLPVYARDILDVGPIGLGVLRSAPAVGALAAAVLLARKPLQRRAGPTLMAAVAAFGAATIVWGASRWLPLTLVFLAVIGFVDMYSVNIRSSTAALVTPNELRGRVIAVEMVFISASNELGAFESGVLARLFGTVTSVVVGGALTMGIAGVWTRVFPPLARMGRLEDLRPEPV
ncbi:MAG TPA: MFS transporter [Gaiellaceae bacterium]